MSDILDREHAVLLGNVLIVTDAIACAAAILAINPEGDVKRRAEALRALAKSQIPLGGASEEAQQAVLALLEDRLAAIEKSAGAA